MSCVGSDQCWRLRGHTAAPGPAHPPAACLLVTLSGFSFLQFNSAVQLPTKTLPCSTLGEVQKLIRRSSEGEVVPFLLLTNQLRESGFGEAHRPLPSQRPAQRACPSRSPSCCHHHSFHRLSRSITPCSLSLYFSTFVKGLQTLFQKTGPGKAS